MNITKQWAPIDSYYETLRQQFHIEGQNLGEDLAAFDILIRLMNDLADAGEHNSRNKVAEYVEFLATTKKPSWMGA